MPVSVARVFIKLALQEGMHASLYQQYVDENDLHNETVGAVYDDYDGGRRSASNEDTDRAAGASGDVDLEPHAAFLQPYTRFDDFRDWNPQERKRQNAILVQAQSAAERTAQDKVDPEVWSNPDGGVKISCRFSWCLPITLLQLMHNQMTLHLSFFQCVFKIIIAR